MTNMFMRSQTETEEAPQLHKRGIIIFYQVKISEFWRVLESGDDVEGNRTGEVILQTKNKLLFGTITFSSSCLLNKSIWRWLLVSACYFSVVLLIVPLNSSRIHSHSDPDEWGRTEEEEEWRVTEENSFGQLLLLPHCAVDGYRWLRICLAIVQRKYSGNRFGDC